MWIFQSSKSKQQKRAVKEELDYRVELAEATYRSKYNVSNFLLKSRDDKHPYMYEVCDKSGSGKFQNPTKLIDIFGGVLLDYEKIRKHPKYAEALKSLGITEDVGFAAHRFIANGKDISHLEAYALVQNYVFLSDQCPSATPLEIRDAARTFYNKGIVITGGPTRAYEAEPQTPVITCVQTLDLNETGQIATDTLVIYGFSPSDKDVIYSDPTQKYDNIVSNYVQSLALRVNIREFGYSGLYNISSLAEFAVKRKEGIERMNNSSGKKYVYKYKDAALETYFFGMYSSYIGSFERTAVSAVQARSTVPEAIKEAERTITLEAIRGWYSNLKAVRNYEIYLKSLENVK